MAHEEPAGLGRAELEELFPLIAQHVDRVPHERQARYLCKAFLVLAQTGGDIGRAVHALVAAHRGTCVTGRSE